MPAAQLCHRQSRFRLSQEGSNLFFSKSLFHFQSPVFGIGLQSQVRLKYGETSVGQRQQFFGYVVFVGVHGVYGQPGLRR